MTRRIIIFSILIFIYLFLISGRFNLPLTGDEPSHLLPYGALENIHPPLFPIILRQVESIFNLSGVQLRLVGIICLAINLVLIYLLVKMQTQDDILAFLAGLLFVLSPLAIQGSLLIDIDNTILTVALTLFILYFATCYDKLKMKDCLILGFLFFLSLFSKFTTPFALIPSLVIFYAFKKRSIWAISRIILISFLGIGLFLLVWQGFAPYYKFPFIHIFKRPMQIFFTRLSFSNNKLLIQMSRIWLWFGPTLLFIPIIPLSRIKKYLQGEADFLDFSIIYIIIIFLGHNFLVTEAHGFPKYLYPILPPFAVSIAIFLKRLRVKLNRRDFIVSGVLMLLAVIYNLFIPRDIIYAFQITLKQHLIFSPLNLKAALLGFSLPILSYPLFILLFFFTLKLLNKNLQGLKSLSLAVLIMGLSYNISLDVLQAKADYATSCYYGRSLQDMRKLGEFLDIVKQRYPQGIIIGPEDVYSQPQTPCLEYPWKGGEIGHNPPKAFLKAILDKRVVCIVYSLSWNSISTYQNVILKPQIQTALKDNFRYQQIGEYSVWVRKAN